MASKPEIYESWQRAPAGTQLLLDRYALEDTLGRGGMATVYRATDSMLGRQVAIKLLHQSISRDSGFVEQFLEMERRIARLYHPNLVTIFDAGIADEGCFVVMEYVAGGSVRDALDRLGPMPESEVTRIVSQVAGALQLLHNERIIHGDIKPDNVLLDEQGDAKLVDFGIARLATTTRGISAESLGGSIPYLAPEQLERGQADARSDVYALGLVTYELLSGRKAFDGENWVAVAAARLTRDPTPLAELRPEIAPELVRTISRATARDPEDRFASAEEFRNELLRPGPRFHGPELTDTLKLQPEDRASPPTAPMRRRERQLQETANEARSGRPATGAGTRVLPEPGPERGSERASTRRPLVQQSPILQVLRGEHPIALPLLVAAIVVDVLLLAIIVALYGYSDRSVAQLVPAVGELARAGLSAAG